MFKKYKELCDAGNQTEAAKYVLYGVRLDTSGSVRDVSVEPLGDPALDLGVNPRLCSTSVMGCDLSLRKLGPALGLERGGA